MSNFEMPQHVIDRVMEKRGRLNVFDSFDPKKTAFLIIDMQNFFVLGVQPCLNIMPNINRLAGAVRDSGGLVAWVVLTVAETEDGPSLWPIYHDNFFTEEKMKAHKNGLTRGTEGHAIHENLDVHPKDLISEKTRFSALIQPELSWAVCVSLLFLSQIADIRFLTCLCAPLAKSSVL